MCSTSLEAINSAEREFLLATRHSLHVDVDRLKSWKSCLLGHVQARRNRLQQQQNRLAHQRLAAHYPLSHAFTPHHPLPVTPLNVPHQHQIIRAPRARSASPETYQFTFTAPLHLQYPSALAANTNNHNPAARLPLPQKRAARPVSFYGTTTASTAAPWLASSSSENTLSHPLQSQQPQAPRATQTTQQTQTQGVKRSADVAFSPTSLATSIPHPSTRIAQAVANNPPSSYMPPPLHIPRRPHAPAVSRRVGTTRSATSSNSNSNATMHPQQPPVEFRFSQMSLDHSNNSGNGNGQGQARLQLTTSHIPTIDPRTAPPLHFYQLVQGGRILRVATPVGGRAHHQVAEMEHHHHHESEESQQQQLQLQRSTAQPPVYSLQSSPVVRSSWSGTGTRSGSDGGWPVSNNSSSSNPNANTVQNPNWSHSPVYGVPHQAPASPERYIPHAPAAVPVQHHYQHQPQSQSHQTQPVERTQPQRITLPPLRTLLNPSSPELRSAHSQHMQISPIHLSPYRHPINGNNSNAEYALFANAGSPGYRWQHWQKTPSLLSTAGTRRTCIEALERISDIVSAGSSTLQPYEKPLPQYSYPQHNVLNTPSLAQEYDYDYARSATYAARLSLSQPQIIEPVSSSTASSTSTNSTSGSSSYRYQD